MNGAPDEPTGGAADRLSTVLEGVRSGTILVAGTVEPSRHDLGLRLLCQYGHADDAALVVTTAESADETLDRYREVCPGPDRPSLRLVDTASEEQSVTDRYGDTPVVFTPSAGDLERLVIALSDLTGPANGTRHLLVRSLTPLLREAPTARVCRVLERVTGLRTGTGRCLLGLDYTAHDRETMAALSASVDGVLWVMRSSSRDLAFEFHRSRAQHAPAPERG